MIPEMVEGPPPSEGPSEKGVRESEDSVVHPPASSKYMPPDDNGASARWAMVPAEATGLSRPQRDVLFAYSLFASRWRIAIVSEARIAEELGWFYGKDKTPNRRHVRTYRKPLLDLGYMVEAGFRCPPGTSKWVKSYLVAPYSAKQLGDVYIRGMAVGPMRQFGKPDAPISSTPMRSSLAHIQTVQTIEQRNGASSPLRGSRLTSQDQERSEEKSGEDLTQAQARALIEAYEQERRGSA